MISAQAVLNILSHSFAIMQPWMLEYKEPSAPRRKAADTASEGSGTNNPRTKVRAVGSTKSRSTSDTLLAAMGKYMVAQDTRSRVADAINMDTLSCAANFDEVRAMRGAGQAYDEAQKRREKPQTL